MTTAERRLLLTTATAVNMLAQRMGLHADIVLVLTPAITAVSDEMAALPVEEKVE